MVSLWLVLSLFVVAFSCSLNGPTYEVFLAPGKNNYFINEHRSSTQKITAPSSNKMSDSENSTEYSSPARATHGDETDKQILQWAGKLELESIDLKDKSSQLFLALQQNSKELQAACSQLNGTADRLDTQKGNYTDANTPC